MSRDSVMWNTIHEAFVNGFADCPKVAFQIAERLATLRLDRVSLR